MAARMDWRLIHAECVEAMGKLDARSFDAVVTDPPYELSFMNRRWDSAGTAFAASTWAAALRVLKPGGHLLAFGSPRTSHRMVCAIEDAGFEIRDTLQWLYGTGYPKKRTMLKPACEPIVLARVPLEGTVKANEQKWGVGAVNIDPCRIASDEEIPSVKATRLTDYPQSYKGDGAGWGRTRGGAAGDTVDWKPHEEGRWPSNALFDPEAASELEQGNPGVSRFFYCSSKVTRTERGEGNNHPTVKPLDLMRWLVRLVVSKGGRVLDPFCGTGSTGLACLAEGVQFVGIEREEEYVALAERRLKGAR